MDILKKNSFLLGGVLSAIVPIILYYVLTFLINFLSKEFTNGIPLIQYHNIILISVFLNMIIFHAYIHKGPYDKNWSWSYDCNFHIYWYIFYLEIPTIYGLIS